MAYYFYILYSEPADKYYTGFTSDLEGRIAAHNHPANKGWTRRYNPWKLVHSEAFITKQEAMAREKQVKKLKRKDRIRMIIENKPI
jgi:putative endonuclease